MVCGCKKALMVATTLLMLQVSVEGARRSEAVRKMIAAKNLEAAGLPDPNCHTGVIAMKEKGKPQVCCAGYCGECSDYPTCKSVRGQNSTFACCKTEVFERRCGKAAANVCLKKCSEAVPPCIMERGVIFKKPDPKQRTASTDCNKAVEDWRKKVAAAVKPKIKIKERQSNSANFNQQKHNMTMKVSSSLAAFALFGNSIAISLSSDASVESQMSVHEEEPTDLTDDCCEFYSDYYFGGWNNTICVDKSAAGHGPHSMHIETIKSWRCGKNTKITFCDREGPKWAEDTGYYCP